MKWIKTSTKMPPMSELVIIHVYDADLYPSLISMAHWTGEDWIDICYSDTCLEDRCQEEREYLVFKEWQVTHWMKLPEKPKVAQ